MEAKIDTMRSIFDPLFFTSTGLRPTLLMLHLAWELAKCFAESAQFYENLHVTKQDQVKARYLNEDAAKNLGYAESYWNENKGCKSEEEFN